MKRLQFLFLFVMSCGLFTACKKDKDPINIPASMIEGAYKGKYGTGSNNPSSFYSFNLKTNGILEEVNNTGTVVGTGTWSISGETFKAKYLTTLPAASYSVKATFDVATDKLTGTWGYGNSETDGGKWFMEKQ